MIYMCVSLFFSNILFVDLFNATSIICQKLIRPSNVKKEYLEDNDSIAHFKSQIEWLILFVWYEYVSWYLII